MTIKAKHDAETSSRPILIGLGGVLCAVLLICGATIALRPTVSEKLYLPAPLIPTADYLLANPAPITYVRGTYAYRKADGLTRMCIETDGTKNIGYAWEFIVDGMAIQPDRWDCAEALLDEGLHLVRAQEREAEVTAQNLRFYEWAFETQNLPSSTPTPATSQN